MLLSQVLCHWNDDLLSCRILKNVWGSKTLIHGEKNEEKIGRIMGFLYGFIWFYMVLYGFIWFCMVSYGFLWFNRDWIHWHNDGFTIVYSWLYPLSSNMALERGPCFFDDLPTRHGGARDVM